MEKIIFNTYKIASKLPLFQIASFFNIKQESMRREYLKINSSMIENILKYSSNKKVYLYKFGCITFVNFTQDEIYYFLEYLKSLYVELDDKLISLYNESHAIKINEEGFVKLWDDLDTDHKFNFVTEDIIASVLAKSTELKKIETELSEVLDEADMFIGYLKKGWLRANSKKVISTISKCIRFKYNSLESVKILDRNKELNQTIQSKIILDSFSEYFELKDRYDIFLNRINVLDSITEEYFSFKSSLSERRLILFEIILLTLFPLMHLIE